MPSAPERVQKHLARLGVASRRAVDDMVAQGRIKIDGRRAAPGDKVTQANRITVDGRLVTESHAPAKQPRVIAYHKPEGELCTRDDPQGRPTVFARLPKLKRGRWVAVGRLDLNSRGLLLFTTDGDIANRLMHPKFGLEREYLCRVFGPLRAGAIDKLRAGVKHRRDILRFDSVRRLRSEPGGDGDGDGGDDAGAKPARAKPGEAKHRARNLWYAVVVSAGRYREVRRAWEAVGGRVSRLIRIRYGGVTLPRSLRPGEWRELDAQSIADLLQLPATKPLSESKDKTAPPARRKSAARRPARGEPATTAKRAHRPARQSTRPTK